MFRSNSQLSAYMMFYQFIQKRLIPVCYHIIKTYTGADKYFLNSRNPAQFAKKGNIIRMIYRQVLTWCREQALLVLTYTLGELFLAGWLSEVCGRATNIMDIALKTGIFCHSGGLFNQGFMASGLKNSSLMECQSAKITAAKASSVARQAELNFL